MNHLAAKTSNGALVYVDLVHSKAAAQIAQQPYLLSQASTLLANAEITGQHLWVETDMGHDIGVSDVIETADTDVIFYAQRVKSDTYMRFVKNRKLDPTSFISIELFKVSDGVYDMRQVILGHPLPALPGESGEDAKAIEFWSNHAFLWGDWPIKSRSITKTCPWVPETSVSTVE